MLVCPKQQTMGAGTGVLGLQRAELKQLSAAIEEEKERTKQGLEVEAGVRGTSGGRSAD